MFVRTDILYFDKIGKSGQFLSFKNLDVWSNYEVRKEKALCTFLGPNCLLRPAAKRNPCQEDLLLPHAGACGSLAFNCHWQLNCIFDATTRSSLLNKLPLIFHVMRDRSVISNIWTLVLSCLNTR